MAQDAFAVRFTDENWKAPETSQDFKKKSLGAVPYVQQEVSHFDFKVKLWCIFCHLQGQYFNKLLHQINFIFGQCNLKTSRLKVVLSVTFRQTAWTWHGGHFVRFVTKHQVVITWRLSLQSAPNFTCLMRLPAWRHLHANIQSVIAPPTGNKKWHVVHFDALLPAG